MFVYTNARQTFAVYVKIHLARYKRLGARASTLRLFRHNPLLDQRGWNNWAVLQAPAPEGRGLSGSVLARVRSFSAQILSRLACDGVNISARGNRGWEGWKRSVRAGRASPRGRRREKEKKRGSRTYFAGWAKLQMGERGTHPQVETLWLEFPRFRATVIWWWFNSTRDDLIHRN